MPFKPLVVTTSGSVELNRTGRTTTPSRSLIKGETVSLDALYRLAVAGVA